MPRTNSDHLHGTLDMLVLRILQETGELHGYAIGRRIEMLTDDVLQIEQGSLYPALYRLEKAGLVTAEWRVSERKRRARFYQLTRDGEQQLARDVENWEQFVRAVSRVVPIG